MRYIRQYNKKPRPIKWTYRDPKRISLESVVTGQVSIPRQSRGL
jgi:hypothetical protein